jgi:hypothetical protein
VGQIELDRDAASRSQSGFFRSRASSSGPNTITPSNISDAHGLEDLHAAKFSEADIDEDLTTEDKPLKQRISMWKSKRRVSEQGKPDAPLDRTLITEMRKDSADAIKPVEIAPRQNTLKKLQRTSSSPATSQIEPKANKKRFSALGALFGRSEAKDLSKDAPKDTFKDAPPIKANRLTKRDGDLRRPTDSQTSLPSGTVAGRGDYYRASEPLHPEGSDIPAPPTRPAPRPAPRRADSSDQEGQAYPIPDGWFDPNPLPQQQAPVHSQSGPRHPQSLSYRQQNASGTRNLDNIPEAFRPVSASFVGVGPVDPIGPPMDPTQSSQEAHSGVQRPAGRMLPVPSRSSQAQRVSPEVYQQRYQYFKSFQQDSQLDIDGPPRNTQSLDMPRDRAQYRYGAENQDHGPGQVYDDRNSRQQAPWALTLPSDAPQDGHNNTGWEGREERYDYPAPEESLQHHSYSRDQVSPGAYSPYDNEMPQSPASYYAQGQLYQAPRRHSQQYYQQPQPNPQRRQPPPHPYEQQRHHGTRVNQKNYVPSYNKQASQQRFYAPEMNSPYDNSNNYDPIYDHAPMYTPENQAPGPPRQAGRPYQDPAPHYRTAGFSERGPPQGPPRPREYPSDEASTMRGASYPGQEWDPAPNTS